MKVKITNGVDVLTVSKSAFENYFDSLNWRKIGDYDDVSSLGNNSLSEDIKNENTENLAEDTSPITPPNFPPVTEDQEPDERTLDEIPLSEMSVNQLRSLAIEKGIDISGVKTKSELRHRIKNAGV